MTAPTPPFAPRPDTFALLVDRNDDTRHMYAEYLLPQGCRVEEAVDGCEALVKALAVSHNVIVTGTQLPGIDGYRLCERHAEQWDYYECPTGCGPFQYRHRTRKLRRSG